jgi:putative lipoprotein
VSGDEPALGERPGTGDEPALGERPGTGDEPAPGDRPAGGGETATGEQLAPGDGPPPADPPRSDEPPPADPPRPDEPAPPERSRPIDGVVRLPADCPALVAARVLVEVRDVSLADAPSVVLARQQLARVPLQPGGTVPFALDVPEVDPRRRLALRVHVDVAGSGAVSDGDLITTVHVDVPPVGSPRAGLEAPVQVI